MLISDIASVRWRCNVIGFPSCSLLWNEPFSSSFLFIYPYWSQFISFLYKLIFFSLSLKILLNNIFLTKIFLFETHLFKVVINKRERAERYLFLYKHLFLSLFFHPPGMIDTEKRFLLILSTNRSVPIKYLLFHRRSTYASLSFLLYIRYCAV